MADVFISYSKADRDLALKLSALLESYGYTTWWDTSLEPADKYRDKIMGELDAARAVISIWTENSVKSDWVRAEAGRARGQNKLIPVKASGVEYGDIPLPFGEMHTEPLDNEEVVLGAVKELLERPQEKPSWWRMSWAGVRHEALAWFGIIGAVLTLVTGLKSVLIFATWCSLIVENWAIAITALWSKVLFFVPNVSRFDAALLTIFLFGLLNVLNSSHSDGGNKLKPHQVILLGLSVGFLLILIFAVYLDGSVDLFSNPPSGSIGVFGSLVWSLGQMYIFFGEDNTAIGLAVMYFILFGIPILVLCFGAVLSISFLRLSGRKLSARKLTIRLSRITIGVVLVTALNRFSLWIEPHCTDGSVLHRLCGS